MTFQFRFAALQQLRRRQRDEVGVSVGQVNQAIRRIDDQISEIERQRLLLRQQGQAARTGDLSVDRLLAAGRYDIQLEAEILSLNQTHAQLTEELQRRQRALVAAEAELKKLERLEEQDRSEYDLLLRRREQFDADDATSRRFTIQRQRHSNGFQTR